MTDRRTQPSCLPAIPERWRSLYRAFDSGRYRGWIDESLCADEDLPVLADPGRLFSTSLVRWFKRGRNLLAEVRRPGSSADAGSTVVLKRYGASGIVGMVRGWLRPPRSIKAWDQAFALRERGVRTPRPLWLALPRDRRDRSSFLAVETAAEHVRLREALKQIRAGAGQVTLLGGELADSADFLAEVARYARWMHDSGIWHRDFSGGNLLIPKDWRSCTGNQTASSAPANFLLIDVNRARLLSPGSLSLSQRLQDLERVSLPVDRREAFYRAYAAGDRKLLDALPRYLKMGGAISPVASGARAGESADGPCFYLLDSNAINRRFAAAFFLNYNTDI